MMATITGIVNGMNGGRGIRCLNDAGLTFKQQLFREYRKLHHLHPNCNLPEEVEIELERALFSKENEGKYWEYATVTAKGW